MNKIKNNQKGFSLTELMVAISIISTVGTITTAKLDNALSSARDANRKMNIRQVQTALNIYYDDFNSYPVYQTESKPSSEGWEYIENILENQENQYISALPEDPLNEDKYIYKYWSDGQKFEITYELEDETIGETQLALGM